MFRRSKESKDGDTSKLTRQQKDLLKQLIKATGITEKAGVSTLKDTNWDLKHALQRFQDPSTLAPAAPAAPQTDKLSDMFLPYKDADSDMILAVGVTRLCDDLSVAPEDISLLVFSWHCKAAAMGEFSKEEFLTGLKSLRVTSVDKLKASLPRLRGELESDSSAREIYNYSFNWAKEKGQKWLGLDTAVALWQLILGHRKWPLVDQWCDFVQERHKKAISRDTWTQLFEFTRVPMASLSHYDGEGAWPTLVDDFVAYLQELGSIPDGKVSG